MITVRERILGVALVVLYLFAGFLMGTSLATLLFSTGASGNAAGLIAVAGGIVGSLLGAGIAYLLATRVRERQLRALLFWSLGVVAVLVASIFFLWMRTAY